MAIESLCRRFSDVPKTLVLKTDALRVGVRFTASALAAFKDVNTQFKGYGLFSQDMQHAVSSLARIPYSFYLKSDDTGIIVRTNSASPYFIDQVEGKFVFCDETGPLDDVYFAPAPKWLNATLADGSPVQEIVHTVGKDKVFCVFNYYCEYWKTKEQCLFCDIVRFLSTKRQTDKKAITHATPAQVAEAIGIALSDSGYRHLALSSGAIMSAQKEVDVFCEYLNAIRERLNGVWYPGYFQVGARPKEDIKRYYETGIPTLQMNLEVWDERLFGILCPGKTRAVGRDEWIRRTIDAVDVFGRGRILSNFVLGVEMAQPWGFKDPRAAVKSTLSGWEYLMAHDVLPRMEMWCVEEGSALAGQQPPPLEYYIEIERGYLELRQKYNFPFPFPAYCRSCYIIETLADWDFHFAGKSH